MQGLQHAGLPQFSIPLGRFAALLAVVSVAAVGFPYLIGAVGQIVAFDGIIVNNAAIPAATVWCTLTYVFVAIGVVLAALYAFKNS